MLLSRIILFAFVAAFAVVTMTGCSSDEANIEVDQNQAFEKYFESKSISYVIQEGVYRQTVYSDPVGTGAVAEHGDSLYFDFAIRQFSTSGPGGYYFTNRPHWMAGDTTVNHLYWPAGDAGIALGTTTLVKGLEYGLPGSREGDSILIYVPSKLGYGSAAVGSIPKDTPLVWDVHIKKVVKQ